MVASFTHTHLSELDARGENASSSIAGWSAGLSVLFMVADVSWRWQRLTGVFFSILWQYRRIFQFLRGSMNLVQFLPPRSFIKSDPNIAAFNTLLFLYHSRLIYASICHFSTRVKGNLDLLFSHNSTNNHSWLCSVTSSTQNLPHPHRKHLKNKTFPRPLCGVNAVVSVSKSIFLQLG